MFDTVKRVLVGQPLATAQAVHERLSKRVALAVLSSDALSSVAYATEEILLVLAAAVAFTRSTEDFWYVLPISLAIVVLLWIVTFSYRQTIFAYPSGGGAYIVAKENLGTLAGLIAAASLLVDYVLTVSVSVTAGIDAITSATVGTHLEWLANHKEALGLSAIALITLANLRGVRESGAIFAVPTYLFIFSFLGMIGWGLVHWLTVGVPAPEVGNLKFNETYPKQPFGLLLLLGAFSSGCTAMTGVEAISNGVPAFRKPESRNAAITLLWMSTLLAVMFLGTSALAYLYHVQPREDETIISQFARIMFGHPTMQVGGTQVHYMMWAYFLVQAATAAILVLAANTSYADFPRLASLMARDRFLPRQLGHQGDRLVYTNGILLLALCAGFLVWVFGGDTSRLIPLYAIGVFLSFTLSQAGMVRHWWQARDTGLAAPPAEQAHLPEVAPAEHAGPEAPALTARGWRSSMVINGLGATVTALVLVIFLMTKFIHGAWIVVIVIPLLVSMFYGIHQHYANLDLKLQVREIRPLGRLHNIVIIPVQRVHEGIFTALEYALSLSKDVYAVYVEVDPARTPQVQQDWAQLNTGVELKVIPSPYRSFVSLLVHYIADVAASHKDSVVTVLLPEFVPVHWWEQFLHNQQWFRLKAALLYQPGIVVTSVPYHVH